MSELATETVEHVEHNPPAQPTPESANAHELGELRARVEQLEGEVSTLRTAQASTEENVERAEDQADRATEMALDASIEASQAEQTAEVAEAVAVAAAEVAIEAEEVAEEAEEVAEEVAEENNDGESVTEVEETDAAPAEETTTGTHSRGRRRRGVYGRR